MRSQLIRHGLAWLFLSLAASAWADQKPYDKTQFDRDIAAGKPTIIYLHATWPERLRVESGRGAERRDKNTDHGEREGGTA
jgi:thioredoxin 1